MMLVGVLLNYLVPAQAFNYAISGVLAFLIWTWSVIVVSHMGYRRAVRAGTKRAVIFRMPGSPGTNWIVLVFLAAVVALMTLHFDTRIAFYRRRRLVCGLGRRLSDHAARPRVPA